MNWSVEPWRKLYTRITADWLQLSVMARGIADELLKYVKDDGFLCRTRGTDAALAVALILTPRPEEVNAVRDGAAALIEDGYLETRDGAVWIRNFEAAQDRSAAAERQSRYRERKAAEKADSERHALRNEESRSLRRSDTIRDDSKRIDPLPGKPNAATRNTVDRWRAQAEEILAALNAARKRVHPASRGISPSYDSLGHIAGRLEAGKSAADCLHVVEVCEAECRARPDAFQWFDAVTPFVAKNFERKCAADPALSGKVPAQSAPKSEDQRPRPKPYEKRYADDLGEP